jgi:uncharacterized damage-inducible protein DinB
MRVRALVMAGVVLMGCTGIRAQMAGGPPPSPPVGTKEDPGKAIDGLIGLIEMEAVSAAKAMPAEKYGFAPAQSNFAAGQTTQFDTVRTFVAQVTHLAQANYFFFASWSGMKPERDVMAIEKITTKDEAVAALQASFAFAHKAAATITVDNAWIAVKPIDGYSTRVTIASFAVAHANDHYGQMVEYLRMNGIVPPASAAQGK